HAVREERVDDVLVRVVERKVGEERLIADRRLGDESVRARGAGVRVVRDAPIALPQELLRSGRALDAEEQVAALGREPDQSRDRHLLIAAVLRVGEAKTDL